MPSRRSIDAARSASESPAQPCSPAESTPPTPKNGDVSSPTAAGESTAAGSPLVSKSHRNMQTSLAFVAELAAACAKTPDTTLDDLLEDLGYIRDRGDDEDEDSLGQISSTFSFNMEGSANNSTNSFAGGGLFARDLRRTINVLARFSAVLAHRSMSSVVAGGAAAKRRKKKHDDEAAEEHAVTPWVGKATVMFVDLSGYSTIAAFLTDKGGAHALSTAVNSYFEAILSVVVDQHAGEVLSFAGDAIVACWPAVGERTERHCAVTAAACAMDLQRKCGLSRVPGTDLMFRLHIGITHGEIASTVLVSRSAASMQAAYPYVSGKPMTDTTVVDCAAVGEVCVTQEVVSMCGNFIEVTPVAHAVRRDVQTDAEKLAEAEVVGMGTPEPSTPGIGSAAAAPRVFRLEAVDDTVQDYLADCPAIPMVERSAWLDKNAVPPSVAKKLQQGFKAAHVAEMRYLCVLFVKKISPRVNVAEWFTEVQQVLDEHRCPVVQVLDDDKGTHLIAAVNLYQAEHDPAAVALSAAAKLARQETGCAVGVAYGEVFCGVTGGDVACRWDITGPTVVRACRLMQHAERLRVATVVDASVHEVAVDISRLTELSVPLQVKGESAPVPAFTLSDVSVSATAGIGSSFRTSREVHVAAREALNTQLLSRTGLQRGVAVVHGPVGVGKRQLVCSALEDAGMGFFVHQCTRDRKQLCVLYTLARWYTFHDHIGLRTMGRLLFDALMAGKMTRSLELAHDLVDAIVIGGERECLVVAYAQFIDAASLEFIKTMAATKTATATGRFTVVLTCNEVWGARRPQEIIMDLNRALTNSRVPKHLECAREVCAVTLSYPQTAAEFGHALSAHVHFRMRPKALDALHEATGGCLALLPSIARMIEKDRGHKTGYFATTKDGTLHLTSKGEDYLMTEVYWPHVAPEVTSRLVELYDAVPPRLQLLLRVIASLSTTSGSAGITGCELIMRKLNNKLTDEIVQADIDRLKKIDMIKQYGRAEEDEVTCAVPAMTDVLTSLITPDQSRTLRRHAAVVATEFFDKGEWPNIVPDDFQPIFVSFVGRLNRASGAVDKYQHCLRLAWQLAIRPVSAPHREKMEERMFTEHRRFPTLAPASLFDGLHPPPLLAKFQTQEERDLEAIDVMPESVFFAVDYTAPLPLGHIGKRMQQVAKAALANYLAAANDGKFTAKFEPAEPVDLSGLTHALTKFEKIVAPLDNSAKVDVPSDIAASSEYRDFKPFGSVADEIAALQSWMRPVSTPDEGIAILRQFRAYHYRVGIPRVGRVMKHSAQFVSEACMCSDMRQANDGVRLAFTRFLRPPPLPESVVHEAIMDLATDHWAPGIDAFSLQNIRDGVLRRKTATACDFKAFLFSLKAFREDSPSH